MKQHAPLRILMTTSTLPRWKNDSELNIVLEIAKNISKQYLDTSVSILAPHCPDAKKNEVIAGIRIIRYKYFFTSGQKLCYNGGMTANIKKNKFLYLLIPFFFIGQMLAIRKNVKKYKINIIHTHWLIPQGLIAVIYKKLFNQKIKIISTSHGVDMFSFTNKLFIYLKKYTLQNINYVTAVSNALKTKIININSRQDKIKVIPNGIDISNFEKTADSHSLKQFYNINSKCLLYVGRLVNKKGVKYLIESIPKVLKTWPNLKLLIVGDGNEYKNLSQLTRQLKIANNIKFTKYVAHNKINNFLQCADIFIGPSIVAKDKDTEGLGIVFLEALASSTPVIATNSGGISDIIKDKQTGLIVEEKNSSDIVNVL